MGGEGREAIKEKALRQTWREVSAKPHLKGLSEWEAAHEELCELQRCGLRVRPREQAAVRYLAGGGRAAQVAEPSPLLAFAATPASFVPVDEEASACAELLELEACGLRVRTLRR